MKEYVLTRQEIRQFEDDLRDRERSENTISKYLHDVNALLAYLHGRPLTKPALIEWKEQLTQTQAPASVNSKLVAVNGFLAFMGWQELSVRLLKIQKAMFLDDSRELSRNEYERLVKAAQNKGNERLSLILQTICATGIRVSELKFITAQAVAVGRTEVCNKGKRRTVFLPESLRRVLGKYLKKQQRNAGPVFVTRAGNPVDRSNIWRDMKTLCAIAGVDAGKVFPHNLRHLFARIYYALEKDISRLADLLGHSNISTTRIYTMESGGVHARQIERLNLVMTT